ncbi:MAG: ribonuclease D, partial [Candidatus Eremiobacteraeota bacterium]|nr:ribonuclease D [Candidatus Eremiobacteraeota bacterium]
QRRNFFKVFMKHNYYQEIYIKTKEHLEDFCRNLGNISRIMLDTEFVSEYTYYPQMGLIQVCTDEILALIDPVTIEDLSPFLDILFDKKVEKVIHAGRIDLSIFLHIGGKVPLPVFDTQVASSLVGFGSSISYHNLVRELCGVRLRKTATYTNWLRRPLSREQIEYAKNDVRYLGVVADKLKKKLDEHGRAGWAKEEFEKLIDVVKREASSEYIMNSRSVKGAHLLSPREKKVLYHLYLFREDMARKKNLPRGKVLRDDLLVEIARRKPDSIEDIEEIRGISKRSLRKIGPQILKAVRSGLADREPGNKIKAARSRPKPSDAAVISLLMSLLGIRANQAKVAQNIVSTRQEVQLLVEAFPDIKNLNLPVLGGWRKELVGNDMLDVLSGKAHLGVNKEGKLQIYRYRD